MEKEIYENLFKNVVINGNYPLEKLNKMKSYIDTLIIKIDNLETQLKKQKEIIDKAVEYIKYNDDNLYIFEPDYNYEEELVENYEPSSYREDLLQILEDKEV